MTTRPDHVVLNAGSMPLRAGLIGASIQASRSPGLYIHEARSHGLVLTYDLFDLDMIEGGAAALPRLLDEVQAKGYLGVNITHPCKQTVVAHMDELSPEARAQGAVNTVVFRDGKRFGHNTDWFGFARNLQQNLPQADLSRVVQLGAGGAGSAVAYALLKCGVKQLSLYDLDTQRASGLAANMAREFPQAQVEAVTDLEAAMRAASGLVNCTPIGMDKYPGLPLPETLLRPSLWVSDIVYFPLETALLKKARAMGSPTLDGGGMVVYQAAENFRLYTGIKPDAARMMERFVSGVN